MKPLSLLSPSRSSAIGGSVPGGESTLYDDKASPPRRDTPNATISGSPRSVRFLASANNDEEKVNRYNIATSSSAFFATTEHDGDDLLSGIASPMHPPDDLPPFRLTREDVEAAFEFLDINGSGVLTTANLKHRLSAFYPQLTSKEYKFLVEDPSGINGVSGGGGSQAGNKESSHTGKLSSSPFKVDGLKTDGGHLHGAESSVLPAKSVANESFGASNNNGGGGAHMDAPLSHGELAAEHGLPRSRAYSSRAGLDVNQLWDLIQSFQQLQQNLGACGDAAEGTRRQTSGGTRRSGSRGGVDLSYDNTVATSLLHGPNDSSNSESVFDAVGEAFRVYDPRNTHYVEREVLSRIMAQIGFGELSEEDLTLLVGTADFDGDGRISLDDFRRLVNMKGRFTKS